MCTGLLKSICVAKGSAMLLSLFLPVLSAGSGKSFSMMGNKKAPGLIPRLCCSLFERIGREDSQVLSFKVEVSYMEIYNEKVRDLLDPKG